MTNTTASIDLAQLDKLEALVQAATPGPWTVRLDGTCSGTWPHIDAGEDEYGDPITVAELSTTHTETEAARTAGEMPGSYEEAASRFELTDQQPLSDAAFIAAANPATVQQLIALARRSLTSGAPADDRPIAWMDPTAGCVMDAFLWQQDAANPQYSVPVYAVPVHDAAAPSAGPAIQYEPGKWFDAGTVDEMQAFYMSRLPAIREAAKAHGYAIGLHGSARRDFDLMAMQWRDGAADRDTLARAIADAACGIRREGAYDWESKPNGRIATSIPVCWTAHDNPDFDNMISAGHIDLSLIESAGAAAKTEQALCEAVRAITLLIQNREWADVLNMDADAAALWDAVGDMVDEHNSRATAAGAGSAQQADTKGAALDERVLFDKAFLSCNGFHTQAELDLEWNSNGGLAAAMFREGFRAALTQQAAPEAPASASAVATVSEKFGKHGVAYADPDGTVMLIGIQDGDVLPPHLRPGSAATTAGTGKDGAK